MAETQEITFGNVSVYIRPRADSRWVIYWREAGSGKQTTAKNETRAKAKAMKEARRISSTQGGRILTIEDAQIVELVKKLAGERPAFSWLREIEDCQAQLKGATIPDAVRHYLASGTLAIERVVFSAAKTRFLLQHNAGKSRYTLAGLRKELDGFDKAFPGVMLTEISQAEILSWIGRGSPAPRFRNNRLHTWKNFFNRCKEWNFWPKGNPHPADGIKPLQEPRYAVPIWEPATAHAILEILPDERRPYLIIGCWLGLRPFELTRLEWKHFEWDRGYLNVTAAVAQKTMEERFVPLNPKAKALLAPWRNATGKCCFTHDREEISKAARNAKLIETWPQDVMRHSYISYRIASGVSKHQVAEEAGNSETVIRRRYRRPLRKEDGAEWFQVK
ncbi:hypothetical protein WJU23_05160 [Prosthecobacter sp. SYSU 5D2]|uniref:tyrosine-type recombinase/integrase n=1 Tax=Prosthecobacter sp. SYSU 5D2 TaxID=3134134 RepID=UPI0031FE919A